MSDEAKVRGYILAKSAAYLRTLVSEAEARRILEGLSPGLLSAINHGKPADWQPATYSSELLRAIAGLAKGNEEKAKNDLINCGRYISDEATTTFLRLLMKVLTPTLFAKRLPSLWSRDSTHGTYDVDVTSEKIVCRLRNMEPYEHIAPISIGFVGYALEAMGKKITQTKLHGWSLATPAASDAWFELHWEK